MAEYLFRLETEGEKVAFITLAMVHGVRFKRVSVDPSVMFEGEYQLGDGEIFETLSSDIADRINQSFHPDDEKYPALQFDDWSEEDQWQLIEWAVRNGYLGHSEINQDVLEKAYRAGVIPHSPPDES